MSEDSELLWRVNNEYRSRLTHASRSLELLIQLLHSRADASLEPTLASLFAIDDALAHIADDHRDWRYRSFYTSPEDRRMVQGPRAVQRALAGFSRMQTKHQPTLIAIWDMIANLPRPDLMLTTVANGDLWAVARQAIDELVSFSNFLQAAASKTASSGAHPHPRNPTANPTYRAIGCVRADLPRRGSSSMARHRW